MILAAALIALIYAYGFYQNHIESSAIEFFSNSPQGDDKKLPGDSMTEKAIENAEVGKQRMNQEDLPTENKPKPNDIQGGVILEGSANSEIKINQ